MDWGGQAEETHAVRLAPEGQKSYWCWGDSAECFLSKCFLLIIKKKFCLYPQQGSLSLQAHMTLKDENSPNHSGSSAGNTTNAEISNNQIYLTLILWEL